MATPTFASEKVQEGYYRQDLNRDTWIVKDKYQDMTPIGIGGFSTVW